MDWIKFFVYTLNTTNGTIEPTGNDAITQPGAGPRHFDFHPSKPWLYVLCELNGTVESYTMDHTIGKLSRFQVIQNFSSGDSSGAASAAIKVSTRW
ncbi:MAG: lactonase family protein [Bacteroidales bacterium]|nr:lactonase family protein [Bacteroidales bacterium]